MHARADREYVVADHDTAAAVGSGSLPVLGTPRLVAWCEAVTCAALDPLLDAGRTSVGVHVSLDHVVASPVGGRISITADGSSADGRRWVFAVTARDSGQVERTLATGEVRRVVVDADRFLARAHD